MEKGKTIRKCECGCSEFYAHQVCHMDVVVDGDNQWLRALNNNEAAAIYDADTPFGPYICHDCGKEYAKLEDIPES